MREWSLIQTPDLGKRTSSGDHTPLQFKSHFPSSRGGGCDAMFALSCSVVLFLCLCLTILGLFPSYAPQRKGPGVLLFFPVGHTVLIPLHLLTELFPLMASGPGSRLHTFHPCTSQQISKLSCSQCNQEDTMGFLCAVSQLYGSKVVGIFSKKKLFKEAAF